MSRLFCKASAALATTLMAMGLGSAQAAEMGAKDEPIKIVMAEWTGQHVTTRIVGTILQRMGYKIEYVTAGGYPQFTGLADGTLDVTLEIWMNNVGDIYPKVLKEGKIEDIGQLGLETNEGWIYPKYMTDVCPGLPDWTALTKPDCVQALGTPETFPNGRVLDYPADWGSRSAQIIKDNDLPLTTVPGGSEGAMVAELESAIAAKKPLLMMMWSPHYIFAESDLGWVKMPPCKSQDNDHCINPPEVHKVVWSGFKEKWPAAYEFLQAFREKAAAQQQMVLAIDKKGQPIETVVNDWVDQNEAVWKPWVQDATR
ncbi:glycine/betaine ABC transporter substrate-binding protein [Mesorhizobium sp. B2-4-9]|uniref:ABC transporter substrate-binding protein n=1 Tax=Mesorhizobium sp. B2-4-9 TaxID=2589940 RepID=UPI00112B428C|nr:ABC transporter substrate-binding protein [Mesorhizobium sp. B2-4-9]TPL23481.1 glycine/betaine ABC transporter substrate-binding protein [Mesorhizobium sp. B2-4-9]